MFTELLSNISDCRRSNEGKLIRTAVLFRVGERGPIQDERDMSGDVSFAHVDRVRSKDTPELLYLEREPSKWSSSGFWMDTEYVGE
jgi:hypothetical protein